MCRLFWNLGASVSWNPQGLSRPVMGLLYNYIWQMQRVSFLSKTSPFLQHTHCAAIHKFSDRICQESFQLWSKPHMHRVINFTTNGKSSCMQGFLWLSKHVIIRRSCLTASKDVAAERGSQKVFLCHAVFTTLARHVERKHPCAFAKPLVRWKRSITYPVCVCL